MLAQIDVLLRDGPALRLPVNGLLVCTQKDEIWSGLRWGAEMAESEGSPGVMSAATSMQQVECSISFRGRGATIQKAAAG